MFACERLTRWAGGMEDPRLTVMLDAGVNLRDVEIAARHAIRVPRCATTGRARISTLTQLHSRC